MTLTPAQMQELQDAWLTVQAAHSQMQWADDAHIDSAVHQLNAAQAAYDALVTEHTGLTAADRAHLLASVRNLGIRTEFFTPCG